MKISLEELDDTIRPIALNGRVVDVTRFVSEHPGGSQALLKEGRAGCDVTNALDRTGHSKRPSSCSTRCALDCWGCQATMMNHMTVTQFGGTGSDAKPSSVTTCLPFFASEASSNVSGRNVQLLESGPSVDYPI